MSAWYNEPDAKAAATLRELIEQGHIAPGVVDERSIEDVSPIELAGFTQRHFFAGGGVWSYALRLGGWPDHWPVVTGSCPCQPFSSAGKGKGFADERHLWPAFNWHIGFGKPVPVFGEQVASKDGLAWLDTVSADLEGQGYTIGATDTCAAGFGAPHIRQRLYWMAYASVLRREQRWRGESLAVQGERAERDSQFSRPIKARELSGRFEGLGGIGRLADASREDGERGSAGTGEACGRRSCDRPSGPGAALRLEDSNRSGGYGRTRGGEQSLCDERGGEPCGMGSPIPARLQGFTGHGRNGDEPGWLSEVEARSTPQAGAIYGMEHGEGDGRGHRWPQSGGRGIAGGCGISRMDDAFGIGCDTSGNRNHGRDEPLIPRPTIEDDRECIDLPGPTNGFWADPDWLLCRDEWWRPVESGTFPLAPRAPERMGRLRMYGNAIVAPQAATFVKASIEELRERGVIL